MANQHRLQLSELIVATAVIVVRAMIVVRVTTTILAIKVRTIATVNLVDNPVDRVTLAKIATVFNVKDANFRVAVEDRGCGRVAGCAGKICRGARDRGSGAGAHRAWRGETGLFGQYTGKRAGQVDKVLRRHGSEIAEMKCTQRRVSALAIDLFGLAATVSRATRVVERKGEDGARRELNLCAAFANGAEQRMKSVVTSFDENDDELRKGIATRAYGDGG